MRQEMSLKQSPPEMILASGDNSPLKFAEIISSANLCVERSIEKLRQTQDENGRWIGANRSSYAAWYAIGLAPEEIVSEKGHHSVCRP